MSILEKKLKWILEMADKVKDYFTSDSDEVYKVIEDYLRSENIAFASNAIASDGYNFLILSETPKDTVVSIFEYLKLQNSTRFQDILNPVTLFTKLYGKEYLLSLNTARMCYAVKSIKSNYALKVIACRKISMIKSFFSYVQEEQNILDHDKIKELHPMYDYSMGKNIDFAQGGRVHDSKHKLIHKGKGNPRFTIIQRLVEYVRKNQNVSNGILFVNTSSECRSSAISIVYTDYKYKEAIVDYLKLLIESEYRDYSFKAFKHSDFSIPSDFRMVKYSCLITHEMTKQPLYIANLYNIATYDPLPCIEDQCIYYTHPIVKLRLLYMDLYIAQVKTKNVGISAQEILYLPKTSQAYDEIKQFKTPCRWVGVYRDEQYEKNKTNYELTKVIVENLYI